jgi:Uma2 family endonuclease
MPMSASPTKITLRYEIAAAPDDWVLPEEPVPESQPHDLTLDLLKALLAHWIARTQLDAQVARNLAYRWVQQRPQIGVDPDLCLITPATPEGEDLESLCTWHEGHHPPRLAIEVVSRNHPYKDYVTAPERYAANGTLELWVFDPKLVGPRSRGGPLRLQQWLRNHNDEFVRTAAGEGPFFSPALNAWVFAVSEGRRIRIADDRDGTSWWKTAEEAAIAEREAAEARIAALEAELRDRRK